MRKIGAFLLPGLFAIGTVATYLAPDTVADAKTGANFSQPELARMVFWHLPCAIVCALFFFAAPYFAWRYLRTKDHAWDLRAEAANEVGLLLAALTLVTGMLFAKVQWGAWWNWDPRQTSFLIATLFVAAYFALRAAFDDPDKRASHSAAYSIAAVLPLFFLIFVFPRMPQIESLHPDVAQKGGFDPIYRYVFLTMFGLTGALCVTLYRLRVRAGLLERNLEHSYAELADRDRAATPRVVRPVSVPEPDRPQGP